MSYARIAVSMLVIAAARLWLSRRCEGRWGFPGMGWHSLGWEGWVGWGLGLPA